MGFDPVHQHDDRPYEWVGAWSERRAWLTPDAPAVTDRSTGRIWTFADLEDRANRAARALADLGVDAGDRVAVIGRNRIEYIDLFLATAKLGAILAPISHRLARAEVLELEALVAPEMLVVEDQFRELVADATTRTRVRLVDDTDAGFDGETYDAVVPASVEAPVTNHCALDDPHLLLHTGGTTGTPKETVLTHGSILWNSINTITGWWLRDDDVTPMVFPFFHTGGWNVLTVPFLHMGGHVIIDREVDPGEVLATLDEFDATVLVAVPAVLRSMVDHEAWDRTDLDSLRFVKSGGGPCREEVISAWRERGVDLSQGYGLTECGPNNFGMPPGVGGERPESVGRPLPHVDVRIVDEAGEVVHTGEIGELELASPHAADRYWRNAGETATTFGEGWVSTGDLASRDAAGLVTIEGRKKDMFVSGGENVYPVEVETAIAEHPAVDDVVVIGVPSERWGEVGLAAVLGDEDLELQELRSFLDERLARYKHPRHLRFLEEMPMSGPDKIDRQAVEARFGDIGDR